jgi:hypothetical protein
MKYPLRIRFWYCLHDLSERLWHWTWDAKLKAYEESLIDRRRLQTCGVWYFADEEDKQER